MDPNPYHEYSSLTPSSPATATKFSKKLQKKQKCLQLGRYKEPRAPHSDSRPGLKESPDSCGVPLPLTFFVKSPVSPRNLNPKTHGSGKKVRIQTFRPEPVLGSKNVYFSWILHRKLFTQCANSQRPKPPQLEIIAF